MFISGMSGGLPDQKLKEHRKNMLRKLKLIKNLQKNMEKKYQIKL